MKIKQGQKVAVQSNRGRYNAVADKDLDTAKDSVYSLRVDQDKPVDGSFQRGDTLNESSQGCLITKR